jgi:hypothetical protein
LRKVIDEELEISLKYLAFLPDKKTGKGLRLSWRRGRAKTRAVSQTILDLAGTAASGRHALGAAEGGIRWLSS